MRVPVASHFHQHLVLSVILLLLFFEHLKLFNVILFFNQSRESIFTSLG